MDIKDIYDIAYGKFNIIEKVSFGNTIDADFGVYNNMLCINLYPSSQSIDWKINFDFFQKKIVYNTFFGKENLKYHKGYLKEWENCREAFIGVINSNIILNESINNGLIICGRSKGGGEVPLIALDLLTNASVPVEKTYLGMIDSPLVCNKEFKITLENIVLSSNIYRTRYMRDIVTMIPFSYYSIGKLIKLGHSFKPFSFIDHKIGCWEYNTVKPYLDELTSKDK